MKKRVGKFCRKGQRTKKTIFLFSLPFFFPSFFWLTRVVTWRTSGSSVFSTVNVFISRFLGSHRVAIFPKFSIGKLIFQKSKPAKMFVFYYFGIFGIFHNLLINQIGSMIFENFSNHIGGILVHFTRIILNLFEISKFFGYYKQLCRMKQCCRTG